ncbi:Ig-specific serine endopeptidase MIP [Mycoplasma simbae]|uniref:Ig-specific serine endopeptidase MIP n=1 Tax=Mycoplasma simbae TaxID=36744 RepID=UPI0006921359|nr:DUF31 family protein [Mycoplasma simbae]
MDYEIPQNGKYPTKWYFGTNSHVARLMARDSLHAMALTFLDNENIGVMSKMKIAALDPNFTRYNFSGKDIQKVVTRIYDATDYLSTSPIQYLTEAQKAKYKDVEEMIDFAVIEIDFTKYVENAPTIQFSAIKQDREINNVDKTAEALARTVTNNYYSRTEDKKVKFLSTSYLKDYSKIDYPLRVNKNDPKQVETDELFALGYPTATEDFFLRMYIDDDQIKRKEGTRSLWVNSDYRFYGANTVSEGGQSNIPKNKLDKGNFLSYNIGYRSFIDKPGLNDGFIVSPIRGKELYDTFADDKKTLKQYFNTGLQYMLRHFVPIGGSSGSSVRNQKNELVGVHSTIIKSAQTDFVAAFRSEGYDYRGAYGSYNLPQYDLIYGGGKDQKSSYLEALIKKYGDNKIHTYLFKNGASKNNVPDEFKFTGDILNKDTTTTNTTNN